MASQKSVKSVELSAGAEALKLYQVKVIHGERKAASGLNRTYALYVPQEVEGLPKHPFPLVVLIHGFLMTGAQQANNAENLAQRGFVVLTPDITKVLLGDETRMNDVHDVIDHISWLTGKDSPVPGVIDPNKVSVGGNSSGGAVILEVALEAQKAHIPIAAIVSLDGVIWDRSFDRVHLLEPLKILSLRCEPSICNEHARLMDHLQQIKFPIDDVKVIGAHHCDVENPTTIRCSCVCGTSHNKYRRIFAQLLYAWLRDNFNAPKFSESAPSFSKLVASFQTNHQVVARLDQPVTVELSSK